MITSILTNPTTLQIAFGVILREKTLIEEFHDFGIACTYDEMLRFKASAATAAASNSELQGLYPADFGFIQAVADNFDASISSPNGMKSTHALALLITQTQKRDENAVKEDSKIIRIKKSEMRNEIYSEVPTQIYNGPKKPSMPQKVATKVVLPLKVLAYQNIALRRAHDVDFDFLQSLVMNNSTPEYGGFNTKRARQQKHTVKPATKAIYTPLIDMVPSDPTTMMTAMVEAQRITNGCGQAITVFTCDQQLYRVVVNITWTYPSLFENFIPRLGGMHMLMSFVGAVGMLMSNSGLEEILSSAFAGVPKLLSGKKFPQNTRALRIVVEEILRNYMSEFSTYEDLIDFLLIAAAKSRTAHLWIDNLITPVFIMMAFVRAEREGDWPLHLAAVKAMLPYFFASNHNNYARYGLYYLRSMEKLPNNILLRFLSGEHVMRHKSGIGNAIWSDMFIETTFMRYGHGPGGIIGITLKPQTLTRWALSLHICSKFIKDVLDMRDDASTDIIHHKEEAAGRIKADAIDKEKICTKLSICIDLLDVEQHPSDIVNIVTGRISSTDVNVDDAVCIGSNQMIDFETSWPDGFNSTLKRNIVNLNDTKKHAKVGSHMVFDTKFIYSRVMGLLSSRELHVYNLFRHELAPIPTSMFDDDGDLRICKSKSVLKRKLQVGVSERSTTKPNVVLLDGCAILWIIHWPSNGTVQDFVNSVIKYIFNKLTESDVYLVFDRYIVSSIKSGTRKARAGNAACRKHELNLHTPLPSQQVILNVSQNKKQLIEIIVKELIDYGQMNPHSNMLVVTGSDSVPLSIENDDVHSQPDLTTSHEEADIILITQTLYLARSGIANICIVCDDTDVFLLLLHHYSKHKLANNITMASTSAERTVIDIKECVNRHKSISEELLAAHAISGCDTTAMMYNIGKGTVLKVLNSGISIPSMGDPNTDIKEVIIQSTTFVTNCYGCKDKTNMTDARFHIWSTKMAKKKVTSTPKLKSLPPTTEAFVENVKRAHFQCCIWKAADEYHPPKMDPSQYGWLQDNENQGYIPITVHSDVQPAPVQVLEMIRCGCSMQDKLCSTTRCGCAKAKLSCTVFCNCKAEIQCQNEHTKRITTETDEEDIDET